MTRIAILNAIENQLIVREDIPSGGLPGHAVRYDRHGAVAVSNLASEIVLNSFSLFLHSIS